ncbi:MAG: shikimate dehydrogenase [Pseudomonadota bacterium]
MIRAAVLGHPIGHSLSPHIHNRWFAEHGLDGTYEAIDASPDDFEAVARRLADEGYAGVNVTIPHKEQALKIAHRATEAARAVGAANLLTFQDGRILADNTDELGFRASLMALDSPVDPGHAVVLGAGGAAAAIVYALRHATTLTVLNRTRTKAEKLALAHKNVVVADWDDRNSIIAQRPELLVNTTSLGMTGHLPLDLTFETHAPRTVMDIIYTPSPTDLMQKAKAAGAKHVADGLAMLVYQAAPSFEALTGIRPHARSALDALRSEL